MAGVPPAKQTALADCDANGILNIHRFAFGISPGSSNQQTKMPQVSTTIQGANTFLVITFCRRTGASPGVSYSVLQSTDLAAWTALDIPTQQVGTPISNGDGTETIGVESSIPISGTGSPSHVFLKIGISLN